MSDVAKRYAQALFEVAEDKQLIDDIEDDIQTVVQVFEKENVQALFANPSMEHEDKLSFVDAFSGQLQAETANFLKTLIDRDRESELQNIATYFTKYANEANGVVNATVTTAEPLQASEREQVAEQFSKALHKQVNIIPEVDSTIVGGIMVRIGNRVYDSSITGKLERFKKQTMQA